MQVKNSNLRFYEGIGETSGQKHLGSPQKTVKNNWFPNIFLFLRQRTEKGHLQPDFMKLLIFLLLLAG